MEAVPADATAGVLDLVSAAHSLKLLGQINHDQGSLGRAQVHFEMACRLLDQIYGAPFEEEALGPEHDTTKNYSTECYDELLVILYAQQKYRKALSVESYIQNDDELFPSEFVEEESEEEDEEDEEDEDNEAAIDSTSRRDGLVAEEAEAEEVQDAAEEGSDGSAEDDDTVEDEDDDEDDDEDEQQDDTMAMLKAIIRSFVRASPSIRRKLTDATEQEMVIPEVAASRVGACIKFVKEMMRECMEGGDKAHEQNEHCRLHIDTEVASLLASIEYSKEKVEEAHFLMEL